MTGFENEYVIGGQTQQISEEPEEKLLIGSLAGLGAAVVGAIIWALITMATNFQIGFMALGVGFLVGITMRLVGNGYSTPYGCIAAALSILGCVAGNVMASCIVAGKEFGVPALEVYQLVGLSEILIETFHPMDIIFYVIAMYEGFRFSIGAVGE